MREVNRKWASIPFLFFILVAILRPDLVLDVGWLIRSWTLFALPLFGILLFPFFASQSTLNFYQGMLIHILIYLLCLLGTWIAGPTADLQILGIFPFSDAAGYFQDAILLTVGKDFTTFSARRPIFSGVLATGLGWTDFNLKLVLIFFTVTVSVSVFLFSKQVSMLFGSLAGFISLFLSFLFYRRFIGSLFTENLGLSLGLLGTILLLKSLRMEKYRVALETSGLFVLTIALLTRAGAFLILPTILFYFWLNDSRNSKNTSMQKWWPVTIGVAAIGIAFGSSFLIRQWTGSIKNIPFGNAAHSFYGMAAGYKGWSQTFIDHPEFHGVQEPLLIQKILDATFVLIQHQPFQLVKAVFFSFGDFFLRIFGFAKLNFLLQDAREHLILNLIIIVLLNGSLFFGIIRLWNRRSEISETLFLLFAFLGILLSAPFVPPIDSDSMRAYAATFPVLILITSYGITSLIGLKQQSENIPEYTFLTILVCLSGGLILIAMFGPWFVRGRVSHEFFQVQKVCPSGENRYVFYTHPTLAVHLVEDSDQTFKDSYPSTSLNVGSLKENFSLNEYPQVRDQLYNIPSGNTIFIGRELTEDRVLFFLATTSEVENKQGALSACGNSLGIDHSKQGGFKLVKIHLLEQLSVP